MYAIEFEADVNNGIIKIPQKYHDINNKHLKIIAFVEQDKPVDNKIQKINEPEDTMSFFDELKNRHFIVDKNINIDKIMQSMND